MLSKIIQIEKDKYHIILHLCGIWKTKQNNKQTTQEQTQTQKIVGYKPGERFGRGEQGEIGKGD